MKTNLKLSLSTLALSLLIALPSFAVDKSGDGRSGADQHGVSIPSKVDQLIEYSNFEYAVNFCMHKASTSLFNQLLRLKLDNPPTLAHQDMNKVIYKFIANGNPYFFSFKIGLDFDNADYQKTAASFQISQDVARSPEVLSVIVNDQVNETLMHTAESEPLFTGGLTVKVQTKKDTGYDELRNFRTDLLVVNRYEVIESPFYRGAQTAENKSLALRLSAEEFTQCLQTNIEKDAQ